MTPLRFMLVNLGLLSLTAPWLFLIGFEKTAGGWPLWALYVVFSSAAYATVIAFCMKRYWEKWS